MKRKAIVLILVIMMIVNILSPLSTLASEQTDTKEICVFDLKSFIYSLDKTKNQYDYLKFATALQGLANRVEPQLYFLFDESPQARNEYINGTIFEADKYWLNKLFEPGEFLASYTKITNLTFEQIISRFADKFSGFVVWDETVPATANVASTISGVENLLPVRYDTTVGSLYYNLFLKEGHLYQIADIKKNLHDKFKLSNTNIPNSDLTPASSGTPTTGSTKNDAYVWAKENYLDTGKTNSQLMAYAVDAYSWKARGGGSTSAELISGYFPSKMNPGQEAQVSITFKNVGTQPWRKSDGCNLGATGGKNKFLFKDGEYGGYYQSIDNQRLFLNSNTAVLPGESYTFKFTIIAPNQVGKHAIAVQMVKEMVAWFGDSLERTIEVTNDSIPPSFNMTTGDSAIAYSVRLPGYMKTGDTAEVEATLVNNGDTTWTAADGYCLMKADDDTTTWSNTSISLGANDSIAPGQMTTIKFNVTANTSGALKFNAQMGKNSIPFGQQISGAINSIQTDTDKVQIPYTTAKYDAVIYSITTPVTGKVDNGTNTITDNVIVKVINTGTETWTKEKGIRLASNAPNNVWWPSKQPGGIDTRNLLDDADVIEPGQSKTFTVPISNIHEGTLTFAAQMIKETGDNTGWFGNIAVSKGIVYTKVRYSAHILSITTPINGAKSPTSDVNGDGVIDYYLYRNKVTVVVKNTGTEAWTRDKGVRLAAVAPCNVGIFDTGAEPIGSRIQLAVGETVQPGSTKSFEFEIANPWPGNNLVLAVQLIKETGEDIGWLGNVAIGTAITYSDTPYNGTIYEITTPKQAILSGTEKAYATVKVINTGTTAWKKEDDIKLMPGSTPWANNVYWCGIPGHSEPGAMCLDAGEEILPGQTKIFTVPFLNTNPGTLYFNAQMIQWPQRSSFNWFGTEMQGHGIVYVTENPESGTNTKAVPITSTVTYPEPVINTGTNSSVTSAVFKVIYEQPLLDLRIEEYFYPDMTAVQLVGADSLIANKAFFFDLSPDGNSTPNDDKSQPMGTDLSTFKKIMKVQYDLAGGKIFSVVGFVQWDLKYTTAVDATATLAPVATEWEMIRTMSTYGGELDTGYASNTSVLSKVPLKLTEGKFTQKNDIGMNSTLTYDKETEYILFYMGDYDSSGWTSSILPIYWEDPKRGELPLTWGFTTRNSNVIPQFYNEVYETMKPNDYFVTSDNGTGYLNPMRFEESNRPSGVVDLLPEWERHNIEYNTKFDLGITGFLIGPPEPVITKRVQEAYSRMTPNGVLYAGGIENNFAQNGTPFIPMTDLGALLKDVGYTTGLINQHLAQPKQFNAFRTVLTTPSTLVDAMTAVRAANPGKKIEVVDPYTFMRLYKEAGGEQKPTAAVTVESGYASDSITIDGIDNSSEWSDAQEIVVSTGTENVTRYGNIVGNIGGEDDLKSSFKVKWDKENLYLLEKRADNSLVLTESGDSWSFIVDASMILLDLNNDKQGNLYTGGAYSLYFTPTGGEGEPRVFLRGEGKVVKTDAVNIESVIDESAKSYTIEMAIPLTLFAQSGFTPANNKTIGVSFVAIDGDNTAAWKGQAQWVGKNDDRATWADMKFVGAPQSVATTVEVSVNPSTIEIPEAGITTIAVGVAIVKDQFGDVMADQTVVYSIPETEGVAIDPSTGVITVSTSATSGTVTVTATCGDKAGTASLTLTLPDPINGTIRVKPELINGLAIAEVGKDFIDQAYGQVNEDANGIKTIVVNVERIELVKDYIVQLPASVLTSKSNKSAIKLITPIGSVTVPGNMFKDRAYQLASKIGISIGVADTSGLDQQIKDIIGDRPIIELNAIVDGRVVEWKNIQAPVTVSIDYIPTAEELQDPEHIVVWYIDGKGIANQVINGRYDSSTGKVTFTVTHFSKYAIVYYKKAFKDLYNK